VTVVAGPTEDVGEDKDDEKGVDGDTEDEDKEEDEKEDDDDGENPNDSVCIASCRKNGNID
jgi:hypothetical protein